MSRISTCSGKTGGRPFYKATLKTAGAPSGKQLLIRRLQMSSPVESTHADARGIKIYSSQSRQATNKNDHLKVTQPINLKFNSSPRLARFFTFCDRAHGGSPETLSENPSATKAIRSIFTNNPHSALCCRLDNVIGVDVSATQWIRLGSETQTTFRKGFKKKKRVEC